MVEKSLIDSSNEELVKVIGYRPYTVSNSGTLVCVACNSEIPEASIGILQEITNPDGSKFDAHSCPSCTYHRGVNLNLKGRISELRKTLNIFEVPKLSTDPVRNTYATPMEKYNFTNPSDGSILKLSEFELNNLIRELHGKSPIEQLVKDEVKEEPVKEELISEGEFTETNDGVDEDGIIITDVTKPSTTYGEDYTEELNDQTSESFIDIPVVDSDDLDVDETGDIVGSYDDENNYHDHGEVEEDAAFADFIDGTMPSDDEDGIGDDDMLDIGEFTSVAQNETIDKLIEEKENMLPSSKVNLSDFSDDDSLDDMLDIKPKVEIAIVDDEDSLDDLYSEKVNGTPIVAAIPVVELEKPEMFDDDFLDEFITNATSEGKPIDQPKFYDNKSAVADITDTLDPIVVSMIRENVEECEADVFRIDVRKQQGIGNIVHRSKVKDLHDNYNDSNMKIIVDRIIRLFKSYNVTIKHNVIINDSTHECPVIDFEGNVRLIFINLDVPGGRYDIQKEINKVPAAFINSCDYELVTFNIYSDMTVDSNINRVVKGVSKFIAFNLSITDVFTPISVDTEATRYFFTTNVHDKDILNRFDIENSPSNHFKPNNGEIGLIAEWRDPNQDDVWEYRNINKNRSAIARGGDLSYGDLNMHMTCTMKYIMLPQKPDGVINVTITEYTECLDIFVRDGFGLLVGSLICNIKEQFPNSAVVVYYELDMSSIPSPTISRYMKTNAVTKVDPNPEDASMNKIMSVISKQNDTIHNPIFVEGEPFDSPEYQSNVWKTYILGSEYRRGTNDGKRADWRLFGKKSIVNTLGEKFRDYKSSDIADRESRNRLLEKLGYQTIIQPQVFKLRVSDEFTRSVYVKLLNSPKFSGGFSITLYTNRERTQVVDDNYMNNVNGYSGAYTGYSAAPTQSFYNHQSNNNQNQNSLGIDIGYLQSI